MAGGGWMGGRGALLLNFRRWSVFDLGQNIFFAILKNPTHLDGGGYSCHSSGPMNGYTGLCLGAAFDTETTPHPVYPQQLGAGSRVKKKCKNDAVPY